MTELRTWYVLQHQRGPALVDAESVFDHPGFADHVAFLRAQAAAGRLIAAGPLGEVDGDGMTVIEAESLDAARQLAEEEDQSVRAGVLVVTVREWQVTMAPVAD